MGGAVADRVGRKRGLLLSQFMGAIGGEVGMILTVLLIISSWTGLLGNDVPLAVLCGV